MAEFKIKFSKPSDVEGNFEDYFGITYNEFLELSDEEREELEQSVTDSFREQIIVMVDKIEYEADDED